MADERYVDSPPSGADGWREVWEQNRHYGSARLRKMPLLGAVRRLLLRLLQPEAERQKDFNLVVLDLVRDLREERRLLGLDLQNVQRELSAGIASVQVDLVQEIGRVRDLVLVAAKRNDALVAALDQKIETTAVRVRDAVNPVAASASDLLYRRLEDSLRGSETEVRADVVHYVRLASAHPPVLDVGCGRGEFLAACREQGIAARGIDTNERSVADLRRRGLDAEVGAIPACFAAYRDETLGAVLAMHVVEHLPAEVLFALFRESRRVLRAGGLLMIETPNAESLAVTASDFWRDPTHLAPRHPAALTTLAREHGFEIDELRAVHEFGEGARIPILETDPPELQRALHAINDRFFAPQDLRLVLRRR